MNVHPPNEDPLAHSEGVCDADPASAPPLVVIEGVQAGSASEQSPAALPALAQGVEGVQRAPTLVGGAAGDSPDVGETGPVRPGEQAPVRAWPPALWVALRRESMPAQLPLPFGGGDGDGPSPVWGPVTAHTPGEDTRHRREPMSQDEGAPSLGFYVNPGQMVHAIEGTVRERHIEWCLLAIPYGDIRLHVAGAKPRRVVAVLADDVRLTADKLRIYIGSGAHPLAHKGVVEIWWRGDVYQKGHHVPA